jgi:hypothetical protein
VPLPHILTIGAWTVAILGLIAPASHAMQMQVAGNQLILSGNVVGDEPSLIADILSKNPAIDTVILRNSRGGEVAAGYHVGEMFRARGLRTAVSGYCNSSCSRMFLGGKERFFTSDYAPASTAIGFHGHYGSDGGLRADLVAHYDLKSWIIQYSDGKADPDLVERWINLPRNNDMVRFFNPALFTVNDASTFLCLEGQRLQQCQAIHKTALDLGIVTSLDLIRSNDMPK